MIETRDQIDSDADAVESIIATATDELRSVYRPIQSIVDNNAIKPAGIVAIINENIVGSAELIFYDNKVIVQGLAVSPAHRKQGVARAMIEYASQRAQQAGGNELALSTIKETGNTNAFLHMGFAVTSEEISDAYESVQGEQVTLVNMKKSIVNR